MSESYVVLPARGVRGQVDVPTTAVLRMPAPEDGDPATAHRLTVGDMLSGPLRPLRRVLRPARVIDELEDGAKLVELSDPAVARASLAASGQRLATNHDYRPAVAGQARPQPPPAAAGASAVTIRVRCARSGEPVAGADLTVILDAVANLGASDVTDDHGEVRLALGAVPVAVAQLRVRPPRTGSWGACATGIEIGDGHLVELQPIDLTFTAPDALRHFYPATAPAGDGQGVKVGVVDTGIDADHPDLEVAGGVNTVSGESDGLYGDNGIGHGTHVAGIVAARGSAPTGVRGLSPAAELYSLRVYGDGSRTASGFAIMKALIRAQDLGCDLVNLSLEAPVDDIVVQEAIADAADNGIVTIGAAGNDGREPVASPARYGSAVTALGRRGTFPAGSLEESQIATPSGTHPDDFLAGFSNSGPEVDFTAPGVGVISTVPGGGHAPDQGTSMAAAAATGMAARLLSANPRILAMRRDRRRTTAILDLLTKGAQSMGLGFDFEGYGMLR